MFHDHLKRFLEVPHWNRKINVEPSIFFSNACEVIFAENLIPLFH